MEGLGFEERRAQVEKQRKAQIQREAEAEAARVRYAREQADLVMGELEATRARQFAKEEAAAIRVQAFSRGELSRNFVGWFCQDLWKAQQQHGVTG